MGSLQKKWTGSVLAVLGLALVFRYAYLGHFWGSVRVRPGELQMLDAPKRGSGPYRVLTRTANPHAPQSIGLLDALPSILGTKVA